MLAMLKNLFPAKTVDLETKLTGATGHGEIEYAEWSGGDMSYEIELRGVADTPAEVRVNGVTVKTVTPAAGRFDTRYSTRRGEEVPQLALGDRIEVWQDGAKILEGAMRLD